MLHLDTDRLAELADSAPTAAEEDHLALCDACAGERDAYVALAGMARAERDALGLPLTRWDQLAAGLAREVPQLDVATMRPARSGARVARWPMQAAAGLLLCAGGAILGRMSAGATLLPERAMAASQVTASTVPARLVGDSGVFATVEEARAAQEHSQQQYERAAAFLAQHDTTGSGGSPVAYRSRLAALDQVISTTREALREAPHDPVINEYYLTTIGQREATLRQLNTALPASLRINSF